MQRLGFWCTAALLGVALTGCGIGAPREAAHMETPSEGVGFEETGPAAVAPSGGETTADKATAGAGVPSVENLQRKIIYTAQIDLIVEDLDPFPEQVAQLAKKFGGYIAKSEIRGTKGSRRSGHWRLRVPVENYEQCLAAARTLGEVVSVRSDSTDVSEEYYDIETRLRNKRRQEDRLLKLLDEATGKLQDVLNVERELARVREEIERMEGRLRVLNDLTTLTTIELRVQEVRDYVPAEAPTYLTRVRRAFRGSIDSLAATAQTVSIAIVVLAPWIPIVAVMLAVAVWVVKFCRRPVLRRRT